MHQSQMRSSSTRKACGCLRFFVFNAFTVLRNSQEKTEATSNIPFSFATGELSVFYFMKETEKYQCSSCRNTTQLLLLFLISSKHKSFINCRDKFVLDNRELQTKFMWKLITINKMDFRLIRNEKRMGECSELANMIKNFKEKEIGFFCRSV